MPKKPSYRDEEFDTSIRSEIEAQVLSGQARPGHDVPIIQVVSPLSSKVSGVLIIFLPAKRLFF